MYWLRPLPYHVVTAMLEHFHDVRIIVLSANCERSGYDIYFERAKDPPPADPAIEGLRRDYEETMYVLKNIDMPQDEFLTCVNQLKVGAEVGLKGPNYSVDSGRSALNFLREGLIKRARSQRDSYLGRLLVTGGIMTVLSMVVAGALYFILPAYITNPDMATAYRGALAWPGPLFLLHPGAALGVVFVAFVANRTITFDTLATFDPYYFPPWLRFFYIAIVSYVMFAALWYKFVMLGIGGYLLNDVKTDPAAGFAIGLACGIGEAVIVELLLSRLKPVERGRCGSEKCSTLFAGLLLNNNRTSEHQAGPRTLSCELTLQARRIVACPHYTAFMAFL
jgi:hypothetical protein